VAASSAGADNPEGQEPRAAEEEAASVAHLSDAEVDSMLETLLEKKGQ
jgi:hypothetical protein